MLRDGLADCNQPNASPETDAHRTAHIFCDLRTHKGADRLLIGQDIVLTIERVRPEAVYIGIEAPREMRIRRHETAP